jgi:hypothetical protein
VASANAVEAAVDGSRVSDVEDSRFTCSFRRRAGRNARGCGFIEIRAHHTSAQAHRAERNGLADTGRAADDGRDYPRKI